MSISFIACLALLFVWGSGFSDAAPTSSSPSASGSSSLSTTRLTPDGSNLIAGSWTVTAKAAPGKTLVAEVQKKFLSWDTVTLKGPTTLTSVIFNTPDASGTASRAANHTSTSGPISSYGSSSASAQVSPIQTGVVSTTMSSQTNGSAKPTTTQAVITAPGSDPDSVMAAMYLKAEQNASIAAYTPAVIPLNECILWDPNCSSNLTLQQAAAIFFNETYPRDSLQNVLLSDPCFGPDETTGVDARGKYRCTSSLLDPASSALSSTVKSWMRQPACFLLASSFDAVQQSRLYPSTTISDVTKVVTTTSTMLSRGYDKSDSCCGECFIHGPNVDVYYWYAFQTSSARLVFTPIIALLLFLKNGVLTSIFLQAGSRS
ncbi:MAG: hypothetical protein Q9191_003467 [Dirinaria sp. TL-2023a]